MMSSSPSSSSISSTEEKLTRLVLPVPVESKGWTRASVNGPQAEGGARQGGGRSAPRLPRVPARPARPQRPPLVVVRVAQLDDLDLVGLLVLAGAGPRCGERRRPWAGLRGRRPAAAGRRHRGRDEVVVVHGLQRATREAASAAESRDARGHGAGRTRSTNSGSGRIVVSVLGCWGVGSRRMMAGRSERARDGRASSPPACQTTTTSTLRSPSPIIVARPSPLAPYQHSSYVRAPVQ